MKKFLFPTILIILSLGLFIMYIDPVYKEVKELREVSAKYNEALSKSKELRQVRDQLLVTYNSFSQNDLERLTKLLPDHVDNVRLVMDINSIAAKYGAIIRDIQVDTSSGDSSPTNVAKKDDYGSVNLGFSLMATYDDFMKFITDIKDSLRLVDITSVSFGVKDNISLYRFNVNIKTYWLK